MQFSKKLQKVHNTLNLLYVFIAKTPTLSITICVDKHIIGEFLCLIPFGSQDWQTFKLLLTQFPIYYMKHLYNVYVSRFLFNVKYCYLMKVKVLSPKLNHIYIERSCLIKNYLRLLV